MHAAYTMGEKEREPHEAPRVKRIDSQPCTQAALHGHSIAKPNPYESYKLNPKP